MKAHIILAHPEPNSFNGALCDLTQKTLQNKGLSTTISDLYQMGFDPREGADHYAHLANPSAFHAQTEQRFNVDQGTTPPDIAAEADRLLGADLLVVHFPLWWFGAPAILKGWMDRVFVYGKVYKSQMRYDAGACRGKKMIACITTGASADACAFNGREADTRLIAWPLLFPFRYIGFDVLQPVILHGIGGVASIEAEDGTLSDLDRYQNHWAETLDHWQTRACIPFNADTDFDPDKRLKPDAPTYSPFISHQKSKLW